MGEAIYIILYIAEKTYVCLFHLYKIRKFEASNFICCFSITFHIWFKKLCRKNFLQQNSYLRTECEKTFFAHEHIIWGTRDEEANVPNMSSRIEICTIFFEMNIMSDLSCILCENRWSLSMRLPKYQSN
jgi:hypothetical protein